MNYVVNTHDRRKKERVFHVNMLRSWHMTPSMSLLAEEVGVGEIPDISLRKEQIPTDLDESQKEKLQQLLGEFAYVFSDEPGLTMLTGHMTSSQVQLTQFTYLPTTACIL